jgi:urease accessory protein
MHRLRFAVPAAALALAAPAVALAHHPMDGATPATLMQGLLSGLGHPLIGPDHFAFILGLGVLAALLARPAVPVAAFLLAALAGTALHLAVPALPMAEALVALSAVALGVAVALGARGRPPGLAAALALAGLLHGYAYGAAVIGAEATPLAAYLIGLTAIQAVVVTAVAVVWRRLAGLRRQAPRLAGGAVAAVGIVMLLL